MNNLTVVDPATGEITDGSALSGAGLVPHASLAVSLARAEVDQQIATARAMPRSIKRVVDNIITLATLDDETAGECIYALPRGNKPIRGPSVRLAEIIGSQWGNCRVGARVVHVDKIEKYVEAEGVFHDLETNAAWTSRVRRSIVDKKGRVYNDDMINVTSNAACSIAKRNAILQGVPKAAWRVAFERVEQVLAGDVKTLSERRAAMLKAFAALGVKPEQLFAALEVEGLADITLDHITTLTGMYQALKSGEETVESMFAAEADKPKVAPSGKDALDKFAAGDGAKNLAATAPPPPTPTPTPPPTPAPTPTPAPPPTPSPSDYDTWHTQGMMDFDDGKPLMADPEGASPDQAKARRDGWRAAEARFKQGGGA